MNEIKYAVGMMINDELTFLTELNAAAGDIKLSNETSEMMLGAEEECIKLVQQLKELTNRPFEVIKVEIEDD
ncbi:hypothetical protein ABQD64_05385 [Vagococcus fluvialis]|uniref:hypothetical protein n=1 Tax=Vagococcus fluvialis TaxID=2738 RepID=UPI0032E44994